MREKQDRGEFEEYDLEDILLIHPGAFGPIYLEEKPLPSPKRSSKGDEVNARATAGVATRTLEEVVMELLKPMLKAWLDENLPPLVERLVKREIVKLGHRN